MKTTITHIAPWLATAAVGVAVFLAPVANAATTTPTDTGACPSARSGQVFGQEGGCTVSNGTNSSQSNLPYDDGGNVYQHAGAV